MALNRTKFYDTLRSHVNLTTQNVEGTEKVLDYALARGTPINDLAYILATAWWETGQTMWPVVEAYWLSEAWRKKNLRYYPWHGRGLIQTTWKANYVKMGKEIGVDLTKNPNLLLKWEHSLPALFVGMEKGLYTGKSLDHYIDEHDESDAEDLREFTNARRIVNGTDKAATIGKLALNFERALKAGKYDPSKPQPESTEPTTPPAPPPVPAAKPTPAETVGAGGVAVGAAVAAVQSGFDWWLVALVAVVAGVAALIIIKAVKD